jgi:hypothetical protein
LAFAIAVDLAAFGTFPRFEIFTEWLVISLLPVKGSAALSLSLSKGPVVRFGRSHLTPGCIHGIRGRRVFVMTVLFGFFKRRLAVGVMSV